MKFFKWLRTEWRKRSFDSDGLMLYHRLYGKFFVVYPDGNKSQNMSWRVANDYRDLFGGKVKEVA